ncbi:MFS monocarboxylate transporter [Colletotrichum plurivorum]|uniref:MFS monocarboxylate transporter n=1 Tax=Colletotrichum plurivorum TaxID=2175906 RepID=A0A8H6KLD6_9PEZI|nr:MFS monocarboxylate transporter [Colletotrichum plurivorum]
MTSDIEEARDPSRHQPTTEKVAEDGTDAGPPRISPADDDFQYSDGGWTAWSQVISGHCVTAAMTWGYPSIFGVYQLYYTETLGLPKAQVSWIGSIQIFIAFSLCALSGRLADAGYSRHAILAGSLLATFGTFMTSLTERYWEILLAQGICTGIGLGLMFMPTVSVISSYFKRRRAIALTISAAGTGTGSTVFPATVQY